MKERVIVHRCGFFLPPVDSIDCLAVGGEGNVAVGRCHKTQQRNKRDDDDAAVLRLYTVEIWQVVDRCFLQLRQTADLGGGALQSLVWCRGRVFGVGSAGSLFEHSLFDLSQRSLHVSASPLWCAAADDSRELIATGSDDGAVHLVSVAENSLQYCRKLPLYSETRILCLYWDWKREKLFGGSCGRISCWNPSTGSALMEINVQEGRAASDVIVWSLTTTKDGTIVSGDSRGQISFFHGSSGSLLASHRVHEADVLSVCYHSAKDDVFAAGVDPRILQLTRNEGSGWSPANIRNVHTHDVRSLAISNDCLISGGLDGQLWMTKFPPKTYIQAPPFHPRTILTALNSNCVCFQYPNSLHIWRLGEVEKSSDDTESQEAKLNSLAEFLVQIRSKGDEYILCSGLNSSASHCAYSSRSGTRIYQLTLSGQVRVEPVEADSMGAASALLFCPSESELLIACEGNKLCRVSVVGQEATLCSSSPLPEDFGLVRQLKVNAEQSLLVAISSFSDQVLVLDLQQLQVVRRLHGGRLPVAAEWLSPKECLVLYGDNSLMELDTNTGRSTAWGQRLRSQKLPQDYKHSPLIGLSVCQQRQKILVHSSQKIAVLHKTEEEGELSWKSICRQGYLACAVWFGIDTLFVAELDPDTLSLRLPPAFPRHRFGTK